MKIGSLFSGIGGLELGLEWAIPGAETAWQVEINPFCQQVLAKHWPGVKRYTDVREVGRHNLEPVDIICGGFPCQDVSSAGLRHGLSGARSGLWYEYRRILEEMQPRIALVENVASGRDRWLPFVRRDLHVLGYRTRAFLLSAEEVGAPHRRQRIFVVAMADMRDDRLASGRPSDDHDWSDARRHVVDRCPPNMGFPPPPVGWDEQATADYQPAFLRGPDGLPHRVDRLIALGNAVMPQQAEAIGRVIQCELLT